jgi:hypothetical protein
MAAVSKCAIGRQGDGFAIEAMCAAGATAGVVAAYFGVDLAIVKRHRARHYAPQSNEGRCNWTSSRIGTRCPSRHAAPGPDLWHVTRRGGHSSAS